MAEITTIIYEYMQHNRRLTLPGLGSFLARGAGQEFIFSEFAKSDDGVLRGELVRRGVAEVAAAAQIESFVESVKLRLYEQGGSLFIVGIGLLMLDRQGRLVLNTASQEVLEGGESAEGSEVAEAEIAVEPEPEPESEPELELDPEPAPLQIDPPTTRKRRRVDPLVIFLIVAAIVSLSFFANGFIIGWRIGQIALPEPLDRVMIKIFGDGFDAVETADEFPTDELE